MQSYNILLQGMLITHLVGTGSKISILNVLTIKHPYILFNWKKKPDF
jgi:hypothetical protein